MKNAARQTIQAHIVMLVFITLYNIKNNVNVTAGMTYQSHNGPFCDPQPHLPILPEIVDFYISRSL